MELEFLIKKVNQHFNVDISLNSRKRRDVMSRAVFYWFAREKTGHTLQRIGSIVNRDHSSVVYSMQNFDNWVNSDLHFKNEFEKLEVLLFNEISVEKLTEEKLLLKYKFLKIANEILTDEVLNLKKQLKNKK